MDTVTASYIEDLIKIASERVQDACASGEGAGMLSVLTDEISEIDRRLFSGELGSRSIRRIVSGSIMDFDRADDFAGVLYAFDVLRDCIQQEFLDNKRPRH